jgi:hypothetical protein
MLGSSDFPTTGLEAVCTSCLRVLYVCAGLGILGSRVCWDATTSFGIWIWELVRTYNIRILDAWDRMLTAEKL